MQKTSGAVKTKSDKCTEEQVLLTYSEKEKQENEINRASARLVFSPEFIPFYPAIQRDFGLSDTETKIYGFIRFFMANNTDKRFYFTDAQISRICYCSADTSNRAISRLAKLGLLEKRSKIKANGGRIRFITDISYNSELGKIPTYNRQKLQKNKNKIKENKINNNKINCKPTVCGKEINQLIEIFKAVNPTYTALYRNTTQRKALGEVVKVLGVDKTAGILGMLPQVNANRYAPKITTPVHLRDKLGQLKAFFDTYKQSKIKVLNLCKA